MDSSYFRLLDQATREESHAAKQPLFVLPARASSSSSASLSSSPAGDNRAAPASAEPSPERLPQAAFNDGYYSRFFRETRKLGRGARGAVYLCQHVLDNVVLGDYAAKKIPVGMARC